MSSRNETILQNIIDGVENTASPQSRIEELLIAVGEKIEAGGGGNGIGGLGSTVTIGGTQMVIEDGEDLSSYATKVYVDGKVTDINSSISDVKSALSNDLAERLDIIGGANND